VRMPETEVVLTLASTSAKESTSAITWSGIGITVLRAGGCQPPVDPHCAPALELAQLPRTISVLISTVDAGSK
jgi:hypothetical protein